MYYFALLQTPQRELTPAQGQAEMQAYGDFHAREHSAIRAGDALAPDGVRISGGADNPLVTDGPFAEGAEVAGGYYVFEAEDVDEALRLARQPSTARSKCGRCCTGMLPSSRPPAWTGLRCCSSLPSR